MTTVLLTGATGYIGSHTWVALVASGFDVVGVDNFSNSSPSILPRLADLGCASSRFEALDVCDAPALRKVFLRHKIDAVIHFAAHKSVAQSEAQPLSYYANNIGGLVSVCQVMQDTGVRRLVFSSSATVYGQPQFLPYTEQHPVAPVNTYGRTKLIGEQLLVDQVRANPSWRTAVLRYFNPVGAHPSGLIGEDPRGEPGNLMPYVQQVAIGRRPFLSVYGSDYATHDGTGVRDYIHVMDLAQGHVAALSYLLINERSITANLGAGVGHSVLDVVRAFEQVTGVVVPYKLAPRRPGDLASYFADTSLALRELGWSAKLSLHQICADSWRWQSSNPDGYGR